MTIFMIVAAVMLVLGFFLRAGNGGVNPNLAFFVITPSENYGDPSSYAGKKVLVETTFDGGTIQASGTVIDDDGNIYADITDGLSNPLGELNFESDRIVFAAYGIAAGQEITIKVSIVEEDSGSGAGGLVVHDNNHSLDKTWQEIYEALASGRSVMIVSEEAGSYQVTVVLIARGGEGSYSVADSMEQSYYASSPDSYPTSELD